MNTDLIQLSRLLKESWCRETAFESAEWSEINPARGQCAISSLIVQDFLGGELVRFVVEGPSIAEKHYVNLINGVLIDTTHSQYSKLDVSLRLSQPDLGPYLSLRERLLADSSTLERYQLFRHIVESKMKEGA